MSKNALKSTTQFENTGRCGLRLNSNTWPSVALGKLKFTQYVSRIMLCPKR